MLYPQVMVDIVKIGVLLSTRIFLLPCVVGFVIYQCWNTFLFGYETALLVDFCINNVIGTVAVLWGMGISFMLYSTIAILQLREILHPSFLARFIRPQESQSDLLTSLLQGKVNIEEPDMMSKKKFYTSSHDFIPLSSLSRSPLLSFSLALSFSRLDTYTDEALSDLLLRVLSADRSLCVHPLATGTDPGRSPAALPPARVWVCGVAGCCASGRTGSAHTLPGTRAADSSRGGAAPYIFFDVFREVQGCHWDLRVLYTGFPQQTSRFESVFVTLYV